MCKYNAMFYMYKTYARKGAEIKYNIMLLETLKVNFANEEQSETTSLPNVKTNYGVLVKYKYLLALKNRL